MRLLAAIALVMVMAVPAHAQPMRGVCAPYEFIQKKLESVEEVLIGRGISPRGEMVVELYMSESGSFTVITRGSTDQTCLRVWGSNWTRVEPIWGDPT